MIIGKLSKIYNHCEIKDTKDGEVEIGENCVIGSHSVILGNVYIGNNVRIQSFAFIPSGVAIMDNVFLSPRTTFCNDKKPPSKGKYWMKTYVSEGVVIGAGAIILPGITIGKNSIIGAGAVVTKDVPDGMTVVGNPAKKIERRK